jgi:hypothetical protein
MVLGFCYSYGFVLWAFCFWVLYWAFMNQLEDTPFLIFASPLMCIYNNNIREVIAIKVIRLGPTIKLICLPVQGLNG